jgi:DNA polymerase III subunit delta'
MRLADVVGHERVKTRLARAADGGRVPAAILLLGPAGIGKRALADAFAARLLCEAPVAGDACGTCAQCTRVAAGTHPDLRVVAREADRRDLRIEQVRELTRWLALQPLMAARKVGIVDDAHCLNEHGQNALLKTLEEPPGASVLLLVGTSPALLLPTVRSRCQAIHLEPLAVAEVARVLAAKGVPNASVGGLAALAEGSIGRALAFAAEGDAAARERLLSALPRLAALPATELSAIAQELGRGGFETALAAAVAWYRDALEVALVAGAEPRRNPDAAATIRRVAAERPPAVLLRQLELVCDTIVDLEKNANRMLSIETMLLALREIERDPGRELRSWTDAP